MKKILILLLLFLNTMAFAIEETSSKPVFYLSDCIKIAIENSPEIKKAKLNVLITSKDINLQKSNYAPTFGAGTSFWQGINTEKAYDDGYNKRIFPTVGLYINQLIFDFGKTSANVDMAKFYKIAAQYSYFDTISKTVNNVKLRYFAALEAKSVVEIEENNLKISQNIFDTIEKLYKENEKSEIDYINADVYLSSAKISLLKAQNNYNKAMADLANALYMANEPDFEIKSIDTFDYYEAYFMPEFILAPKGKWHEIKNRQEQKDTVGEVQNLQFSLETALDCANKNNLELKTLNSVLDAVKKTALSVKRQYLPDIKARVGYDYGTKYTQNNDTTLRNNQLNLAVNLDTGINPKKYSNELDKINLQVEKTEQDIELFRQNMYFEVKKSYMDVETAQKQIQEAKNRVLSAKKNLEIANKSYLDNKIGYIEFQSARQNYNSSKIQYINELSAYNTSLAKLEQVTLIFEDNFIKHAYNTLSDKEKKTLNLEL